MPRWKVGDVCYGRFLRDREYFEPRRIGVVVGVGRVGFTVELDKPLHNGDRHQQFPYYVEEVWPSLEEGEAYCREHPTVDVGRAERTKS